MQFPPSTPTVMSSPHSDRAFDPSAAGLTDRVLSAESETTGGHEYRERCETPGRSPRGAPVPIPVGTPHQPHSLSPSNPTSPCRPPPAGTTWHLNTADGQQSATPASPISSHFSYPVLTFPTPSSNVAAFRATLTNDRDEDYDIDADDDDMREHGPESDAMANDEGANHPSAGGNSSDELMMMDSDDDPMEDAHDDDDGLELMYHGPDRDLSRSLYSLTGALNATMSRNPSEVELVVISDDDETFARVDQTQVEQVLDKLREGAEEDGEGEFDDDVLFIGETFDTSGKRNKVDLLPWDFKDDRLPQARPDPSLFGTLPSTDDLGPQPPSSSVRSRRGSRGLRGARPSAQHKGHGPRRARSVSPMATPRARSRSHDRTIANDHGAQQAKMASQRWSEAVAHHPSKYELAMLGDFVKVLFMLPRLDEKQKGQQIQLVPGPLGPVLHNIQQLIKSRVTHDQQQVASFHMYLSTLGLDPVTPIRSRLPMSKFNLELLPLLPRTLTRPIPLLIPTFLQTQQMVSTFSAHPHMYLINAFHRAGRPPPANVPMPHDILPWYISVDMPPDYNHRLYKLPAGTHSAIAFEAHEINAVTSDFDILRAINEGREPATVPAASLWVPPGNYAASSSATRAKRGDERFDTVVAMVAMALGIYGRDYEVPFVIVVSPFNHDLRNLRYAMHARNILTVCVETVEEFVCLDKWLRLWCRQGRWDSGAS